MTPISNVGDKHIWRRAQAAQTPRRSLRQKGAIDEASLIPLDGTVTRPATPTGHGDRSAVHVQFLIADVVEPRPGKSVIASSKVLRDGELIGIRISCTGIASDIAIRFSGRTATFDGVDHFEHTVLGRHEVR